MAVYWLTFRLEMNATYSNRHQALMDAVERISTGWWTEPTSFLVFESDQSIDGVAGTAKSAINPAIDLVLIGMPDYKSARVIGTVTDPDLFKLVPFTKKA
jgi:hypothetical protein